MTHPQYNPLDRILTLDVPPRPQRAVPQVHRVSTAKVLLLTSSIYDLRLRRGDWARSIRPGVVMEETKTFRSPKQAHITAKKISENNLVVYCHQQDYEVRPFVIAVGITKGCRVEGKNVHGRWQVLASCTDWDSPLESPLFGWGSDSRAGLRKVLCRPQWFTPVPKFWRTYESLIRSDRDMNTHTDAKRLVTFVEQAFQQSSMSRDVWEGVRSV
jgi:hypothetical protein